MSQYPRLQLQLGTDCVEYETAQQRASFEITKKYESHLKDLKSRVEKKKWMIEQEIDKKGHTLNVVKEVFPALKEVPTKSIRPRYKPQTELWQLISDELWDKDKIRKKYDSSSSENAENYKRKVFKDPICRTTSRVGEWIEPDPEIVELVMKNSLIEELKEPFSVGYTGIKASYFDLTKPREAKPVIENEQFKTTSKITHRFFPKSEYKSSPYAHTSPLSKTISFHHPFSCPYNEIEKKHVAVWVRMSTHQVW